MVWLADGDSLKCCIVTVGRWIAEMFSTFYLWGSLFLMRDVSACMSDVPKWPIFTDFHSMHCIDLYRVTERHCFVHTRLSCWSSHFIFGIRPHWVWKSLSWYISYSFSSHVITYNIYKDSIMNRKRIMYMNYTMLVFPALLIFHTSDITMDVRITIWVIAPTGSSFPLRLSHRLHLSDLCMFWMELSCFVHRVIYCRQRMIYFL